MHHIWKRQTRCTLPTSTKWLLLWLVYLLSMLIACWHSFHVECFGHCGAKRIKKVHFWMHLADDMCSFEQFSHNKMQCFLGSAKQVRTTFCKMPQLLQRFKWFNFFEAPGKEMSIVYLLLSMYKYVQLNLSITGLLPQKSTSPNNRRGENAFRLAQEWDKFHRHTSSLD